MQSRHHFTHDLRRCNLFGSRAGSTRWEAWPFCISASAQPPGLCCAKKFCCGLGLFRRLLTSWPKTATGSGPRPVSRRLDEIAHRKERLIAQCARERDEISTAFGRIRSPFQLGGLVLALTRSLKPTPLSPLGYPACWPVVMLENCWGWPAKDSISGASSGPSGSGGRKSANPPYEIAGSIRSKCSNRSNRSKGFRSSQRLKRLERLEQLEPELCVLFRPGPLGFSRVHRAAHPAAPGNNGLNDTDHSRFPEYMPAPLKRISRLLSQVIFHFEPLRQPLVVDTRGIDGLVHRHAVIDHVQYRLQGRTDNARPTGAADDQLEGGRLEE